ncbi:MAG TPA: hypothetical protein VEB59_08175, partial [Gemmatimonadales bacterium]|nr:hypothetical protein [Gemmatimonadales bacterium]
MRAASVWSTVVAVTLTACSQDLESPSSAPALDEGAAASAPLSFAQVSSGVLHACGVTTDNRAYCWGSGGARLGVGVEKEVDDLYTRPVPVKTDLRFRFVTAGTYHTCGLTTDDRAYCWGYNFGAFLGDGSRTTRLTPVPVADGRRYRQLEA